MIPYIPFSVEIRGVLGNAWRAWFTSVKTAIDAAAQLIGAVALVAQGASIGTTAVPTAVRSAGLYRVSYYARITRAATTSSSLTVTISWTDGGVNCFQAGAAIVGNTTATAQSGSLLVRTTDPATIGYATAYASVGGTSMLYAFDVLVEAVKA